MKITNRNELEKEMIVKKHAKGKTETYILASDPYEKMPGEWFVNVAPMADPEKVEVISLLVYGCGDEIASDIYWLETLN